jgi:hypothetical protein
MLVKLTPAEEGRSANLNKDGDEPQNYDNYDEFASNFSKNFFFRFEYFSTAAKSLRATFTPLSNFTFLTHH